MALVAYSDESDFSDDNEQVIKTESLKESAIKNISGNVADNSLARNSPKENDKINFDGKNTLPADVGLPPISNLEDPDEGKTYLSLSDNNDIVDDVPTVKTWGLIENISKTKNLDLKNSTKNEKSKLGISKLKLILPSLAEFDDEEEEETKDESRRKKICPSGSGTGLFAVLPKPRGPTSLVPNHVRKKYNPPPPQPNKKELTTFKHNKHIDSDEEIDSFDNFFSLSDSPTETLPKPNISTSQDLQPNLPLSTIDTTILSPDTSMHELEKVNAGRPLFISFYSPTDDADNSNSHGIEEEALRRLAGGRNKSEIPTIIDIKADDALMSREEWVTRALCDEKPKTSFSTKKEGNPTLQQKRKHQITYLAHQAQEREKDLQNNWGQNRFTKIQTRSKYGF